VAAQLVATAGLGEELDERVAAAGVAVHRMRQLDRGEAAEAGARGLGDRLGSLWRITVVDILGQRIARPGALAAAYFDRIEPAYQRVVDHAVLGRMTAHDRQVALVHRLRLEALGKLACHFSVECEQQHARGAAIQAMGGIHPAADLVAQQLHGEALLVRGDRAAVHEQSGRLVDRDQPIVAVENLEHLVSRRRRLAEAWRKARGCRRVRRP
jgi:hypothetical protein